MRIAFVTPYFPYPPDTGGKIRSFYLLQRLACSHQVDLFTVYYGRPPEQTDVIRTLCHKVHPVQLRKSDTNLSRLVRCFIDPLPRFVDHFHTPSAYLEIRRHLEEGQYDLLVSDEICMAIYMKGLSQRKVVNRHKVDFLHYRDMASLREYQESGIIDRMVDRLEVQKLRRYEHKAMVEFNAAVCCSEEDASAIKDLNPDVPVTVIGNGVDLDHFIVQEESSGPPTLMFAGTMNYYPNIDAAHYFFQEIYGHLIKLVPAVQILIVGHDPPPDLLKWQHLPGVKFTGSVSDTQPYLARSTATFVPLRLGRGTRLKILESIASGRAVVSTTVGAEGLGMRHGEHLLIADDPREFARCAASLLDTPDLRRRLIAAARPYVAAHFSWQALGERFEAVCRQVAGSGTL